MRPPDLENKASAWLIPINRQSPNWRPDHEGSLVDWLLNVPWAHPFWAWYAIIGIHLRPIPGVKPPFKQFPEADHEICILSLDPKVEHDPDKLYRGEQFYSFLTPADLTHQVEGLTDTQFVALVQDVVLAIVHGQASPDSDYREWWKRVIDKTAEHIREGKHKVQ